MQNDGKTCEKNVEIEEQEKEEENEVDTPGENEDENYVEKVSVTIVECSSNDHDRCSPGSCYVSDNDERECSCPSGYVNKSNHCVDIDECAYNTHKCSHTCHNSEGAFSCSCPPGLHLSEDGMTCDDFDECQRENICGSTLQCLNTYGSYRCVCPEEKQLDESGNCQLTDLCHENNGGCSQ